MAETAHDAKAKLFRDALRFAVWAAGESITPADCDVEGPEDFLFAYTAITGDEEWETLPDRLSPLA